ncbi:thioredoxin domain-containing protein [Corynebacterium sp.]|uniref:DsbA family protein n=1 Tax=Corynebacterium sp. TaxID=1720 RepID=UPI0026DB8E4C|nr:thioredoxin domain-containing protein [Corynebacterium sp.]MDO5076245.1 thioredoxin domain-containing protein [Corynebacterium sp.]
MSKKIQNPNEKGNGFLWAVLVVLLLAMALVGYIVISGKDAKTDSFANREQESTSFDVSFEDNAAVLKSSKATSDTPTVDLYEDFSCPSCAKLAEFSDADMKKAIEDGKLVVHVRSLHFLDRGGSDGQSSRAGAAAQRIAEGADAAHYWNYRAALMAEQANLSGWEDADYARAAEKMGVADDVVTKISEGGEKHEDYVKTAEANSKKLEDTIGKVSSPHVIHNGQDVPLDNWVATVTAGK